MSKLKRDIASWSKRVMMSKTRIWAVVEGKSVDAPFYEGVLRDTLDHIEVEIIKAEDIEIEGVAAGGKANALKAFRYFKEENTLRQSNSSTVVDWVFFVDRDDDDFTEKLIDSSHVLYTNYADVEAEVFANTDPVTTVSMAYSLPTAVVRRADLGDPLSNLGELWLDWIALRLATGSCGAGGARFSQASQVNRPVYGARDASLSEAICERAADEVGAEIWIEHRLAAMAFLEQRRSKGNLARSVKGKWVPAYIAYMLQTNLGDDHNIPKISSAHLLAVGVARLDFSGEWGSHYRTALRGLTAA